MSPAARTRLKAWLSIAARYAFGAFLIYWLIHTEVLAIGPLRKISGALIVQGVLLGLSITAISTVRMRMLLRDQSVEVSYRRCFVYICIGLFYSLFLPGGVSGDAAKAFYFFRDAPGKKIAVLGAIMLDRFLGLITLLALGLLSGLFLVSVLTVVIPYLLGFGLLLLILVAGLVLVLRYEITHQQTADAHWPLRMWEKVKGVVARLHLKEYSTRTLVNSMLLSALMNALTIVLIWLCSELNKSGVTFTEVAAVSPLGLLSNAVPLSPGGLGVGEKTFDILYKAVGGENGAGSFLAARIFLYCPSLIGGVFAAWFMFKLHHGPTVTRDSAARHS